MAGGALSDDDPNIDIEEMNGVVLPERGEAVAERETGDARPLCLEPSRRARRIPTSTASRGDVPDPGR